MRIRALVPPGATDWNQTLARFAEDAREAAASSPAATAADDARRKAQEPGKGMFIDIDA